jgi:membrane fusion protein (multidrug efflux system)
MQTFHRCSKITRSLLVSSVLLAVNIAAAQQKPAVPAVVEFTHPKQGNVNRWVTLPASIKAKQEAVLYAKVAGYLQSISVDKGDTVKAGATLAVLETPELTADLARYRAESDAAKAEFERMQQAIKQAPDLVMPAEMDRAKGKYDVAKANLERTQSLLAFNKITAPFSGVITKRFVDPGAFIPAATSGSTAQTAAVVTLMDFSNVRVQIAVPEAEAPLVNKGQAARFSVEGLPDKKFEGKITRLSYALDDASKTMLVEVELANPSLELRPGMYASVQLALQHHDNVMLIPTAALVMEKANAFTYTINGTSAKKRPLKIGFNDGAMVEVQEGIAASDSVILVGKKPLTDGAAIKATEAK